MTLDQLATLAAEQRAWLEARFPRADLRPDRIGLVMPPGYRQLDPSPRAVVAPPSLNEGCIIQGVIMRFKKGQAPGRATLFLRCPHGVDKAVRVVKLPPAGTGGVTS